MIIEYNYYYICMHIQGQAPLGRKVEGLARDLTNTNGDYPD
jgi:hypothetical protein